MLPRLTLPRLGLALPSGALALVAALFVLPGLAGHDPWKSHDAIGLGIVHGTSHSPLFHWVALAFGAALRPLLEFHAAARLASGAFMFLAFWMLYAAARRWAPAEQGRSVAAAAVLLLLGSVGLIVHAHEALPELASLAAICAALAALPYAIRRPGREVQAPLHQEGEVDRGACCPG